MSAPAKRLQQDKPDRSTGGVDAMVPPTAKRLRVDESPHNMTDCVLRRSKELIDYLNISEVLRTMLTPVLTFLTPEQIEKLEGLVDKNTPSQRIVRRLIQFITQQGHGKDDACRKLVASIILADDHRGHKELHKIFHSKLPAHEYEQILQLVSEVNNSPMPSPYRSPYRSPQVQKEAARTEPRASSLLRYQQQPERPIAFITLQGMLGDKHEFGTIEDSLWHSFSTGDYKTLEDTVKGVFGDPSLKVEVDCQIVAMWFNSLIIMHKYGEYSRAIEILNDALDMCGHKNCINGTILEGRIYQRMSQNHLMLGRRHVAMRCFEQAKERLQMVGRGYDKANMLCREAKILSAQETEHRGRIEETYDNALRALEQDDPYFLASFPSITLSKTAFYLRVSFGSKAGSSLPQVDPTDIRKAEETLETIRESEHILLEMRRFEYNFLLAELCRLRGREEEARERFQELTSTPGSSKVENILSLAEQRLQSMEAPS